MGCYSAGEALGAQADLDEAWDIAERGPMRLHLADIHLHRARLFFGEQEYPWNKHPDGSPRGHGRCEVEAVEKVFGKCGGQGLEIGER